MADTVAAAEHLAVLDPPAARESLEAIDGCLPLAGRHLPEQCTEALTLRAWTRMDCGDNAAALRDAEAALDLATRHQLPADARAGARMAKGRVLSQLRDYDSAREMLRSVVLEAAAENLPALQGRALRLLAETHRRSEPARVMELTEEAFTMLQAAGETELAGECAGYLAYWHSEGPAAGAWAAAAEPFAERDPRVRLWLHRARMLSIGMTLDHDAALTAADDCLQLARVMGHQQAAQEAAAAGMDHAVHTAATDRHRREETLRADLGPTPDPHAEVLYAAVTARHWVLEGDPDRAHRLLENAAGSAGLIDLEHLMILEAQADVATLLGRWATAVELGARAMAAYPAEGFEHSRAAQQVKHLVTTVATEAPEVTAVRCDTWLREHPERSTAMAAYVTAVRDLALAPLGRWRPTPRLPGAPLEASAIAADAAAVAAEASLEAETARSRWRAAGELWRRLGCSIWLARAQWRAGDRSAAEDTLRKLGAGDDQRAWCDTWGRA